MSSHVQRACWKVLLFASLMQQKNAQQMMEACIKTNMLNAVQACTPARMRTRTRARTRCTMAVASPGEAASSRSLR